MIKSMTGYGGGKCTAAEYELSVELKSVNNRFADISVRTPKGFMFAEEAVKSAVQSRISRGKIDVFVTLTGAGQSESTVVVNEALAAEYAAAVALLADRLGLSAEISAYSISRYPDVLTLEKKEIDKDEALKNLLSALEQALSEHDAMRTREGERLRDDLLSRLEAIEKLVGKVEERSPQTVAEYRQRLGEKMREVLENAQLDENRILTEAAIFADKVAVDEETVRLRSHISQMREMLSGSGPVGRKLDFIVQELNREVNTIGSKCNDGEITSWVLDMKSEIEKIREQVQNIE